MHLKTSFVRTSTAVATLLLGLACPTAGYSGWYSNGAWAPPPTYSIPMYSNTYNYYWGTSLGGIRASSGLAYPMIYHPTDTTQQGFYYQSVPRWQYRPEMLPAAPVPYWPVQQRTYGGGYSSGGMTTAPATTYNNTGVPPNVTPITPAPPPPVVAPPPPPEPAVNVPEPEAAVFPRRARR